MKVYAYWIQRALVEDGFYRFDSEKRRSTCPTSSRIIVLLYWTIELAETRPCSYPYHPSSFRSIVLPLLLELRVLDEDGQNLSFVVCFFYSCCYNLFGVIQLKMERRRGWSDTSLLRMLVFVAKSPIELFSRRNFEQCSEPTVESSNYDWLQCALGVVPISTNIVAFGCHQKALRRLVSSR
jgi:hypothetical protein